ncbi:MAG: GDSL-type esterase/lipase family protein [Planctomycetota bacterium]
MFIQHIKSSCRCIGTLVILAGLLTAAAKAQDSTADSSAPEPVTIVAFGDSTTALRSTVESVYAVRLERLLAERGVTARVINSGVGGSHTGRVANNGRFRIKHALDRFEPAVRSHKPDVVIVQFGWNDSWVDSGKEDGPSRIPVADYSANLREIVSTLRRDGAIVVLATPNHPWSKIEAWRRLRTLHYIDAVRSLAKELAVPLVDVWAAYEEYNKVDGQSFDDLLLDSVHPNDDGHSLFADLLDNELEGVLSGDAKSNDNTWRLVSKGRAVGVSLSPTKWEQQNDFIEGAGVGNDVVASRTIGDSNCRITARLRMAEQKKSAASFFIGGNHFGFEGASETVFVSGPLFGKVNLLQPSTEVFERGDWIEFEATYSAPTGDRSGKLTFSINGKKIHAVDTGSLAGQSIGLRPWRSRMQVAEWSIIGSSRRVPTPLSRSYSIPTLDLADQKDRQVVVDREPGQYLGHPTTLLLEDGKTILCVYPKGHGRGAIVYKRSSDGGLTWSDRLPTPKSWETSKEVPTLHRVVDAQGKKRIIMFSGLYPVRMAVSEDDGASWSELKKIGDFGGIVTMGCVIEQRTAPGHYMALFHDDGRFIADSGKRTNRFIVYQTESTDGGLTWSAPVEIATHDTAHLCEPGVIRSPDGKTIAVLLRENSRRHNSFVIFSHDEGKTWSTPRELPASLTGDRHTGVYAPDGRLFISFRDKTHVSPTPGDWVAWVGTWDDIAEGREGQYRVRLMDNTKGSDCAYPGVLLLPDGTIVTTTYGHWDEGEAPYIVTVRLKLEELDSLAACSESK